MAFTHLHVHTEYSLLDGANKIREYVAELKRLGMDAGAITDHGVMYGCIDFYKEAKAAGIRPIMGCEVYVAPGSRFDREPGNNANRYFHLVLLAENNTGYANLTKIVSKGFIDGFYYKPRVDLEVLREFSEGIIASSACLAGEVSKNILVDNYEEAKAAALRYRDIFGENNFFLELQDHGLAEQKKVNAALLRLSQETGIPLIATNDVHYTYKDDVAPHDILLCIQTGKKLSDENRMRYEGGQYYLKSPEEMSSLFAYAPSAIENTEKIAKRCNVEIEFGVTKLPKFSVPDGFTSWEYLQKLCTEGLENKYENVTDELRGRLRFELDTIHSMGYVDYFLIVWDFIKFAKDHGIMVGPGRGSAAGSLVSYVLNITELDPLKYNLLFERFLNPERISMPDIDVDFADDRRGEVIEYVVEKYGKDCVVQIVTFGTLMAKGVIRDVGRVMDLPYAACDSIAKMIPNELKITIDRALLMNPALKELYQTDERVHTLIDMAKRLEGLPRHASMHAAGVVISGKPVEEYVPVARAADNSVVTQFTMTTLEELGLLKMDFLGLRTLTVIQNAIRLAEKSSGKKIDISRIDMDDKDVYDMISAGKSEGVFQLESAGMKNFMKELKPHSLEDVIAGIALYRPGPMDFIPAYIRGKNDPSAIKYECEQLRPILEATYGCIVYQEQVMQIVRDLGGFTLGRSDLLRRAMSKKKTAVMEKERQSFVYGNEAEGVPGCIKNGIPETVANHIYDSMIDFAKYAFNKSHAAAYAIVSYQTAWLKYYYPAEYMAAIMTSVADNPGKIAEYIQTCRQMGIGILPPDINKSEGMFSVEDGKIRYGLTAVKGIGHPVMAALEADREKNGPYKSLSDLAERLSSKEINRRTLESFIKSGACDCFGAGRRQMMLIVQDVLDKAQKDRKTAVTGQMSLFEFMNEEDAKSFEITLPDVPEYDRAELLALEKEVLQVYVSGHPLEDDEELIKSFVTAVSTDFLQNEETGVPAVKDNSRHTVGGMITALSIKYTRQNKPMAFVTLEDMHGTIETIVFPKDYERLSGKLVLDEKVFISGRVSVEEDKPAKLIFESMKRFDDVRVEFWIRFPGREAFETGRAELRRIAGSHPGDARAVVYLSREKVMKKIDGMFNAAQKEQIVEELSGAFGKDNVQIVIK